KKSLDIAVNAQRMIGKKAEEIRKLKNPETDANLNQQRTEHQDDPNKQEKKIVKINDPEVLGEINKMVISKLKEDFPDLQIPDDPAEFTRFVSNLHYDDTFKVDEIKAKKRSYETSYRQQFEDVVRFRDNYVDENRKVVQSDIDNIYQYAKDVFDVDIKTLGFDLTLDKEGANPIVDALMLNPDGNSYDPKITQYGRKGTVIEGIPVVSPNAIFDKFFRTKGKEIVNAITKAATKTGFESATKIKDELPNSLSDGTVKGENINRKENLSEDDIEKLEDPEQIKQVLANIEIK
ncbi:MAG: hypothetical protein ACP5N7_05650, partial [Candidatus Pacearchaeota archaeon]